MVSNIWKDIKLGWHKINREALVVFPVAILVVGAVPVGLEAAGFQPWSSRIISAFLAALLTAVEMLRVRGRMERTGTYLARLWA